MEIDGRIVFYNESEADEAAETAVRQKLKKRQVKKKVFLVFRLW